MPHSRDFPRLDDLEVMDDRRRLDAARMVGEDTRIGESVGRGDSPPVYRVWENEQALVVTARDATLPNAEEAMESAASNGWPAVIRDSGGGAVPHGPGILELSLLLPQNRLQRPALEVLYEALCAPVRMALRDLGIETTYGDVPGSFCDGRFNLVVNGRKIAGTSQRWRGGIPPGSRAGSYVLAHMILFVEADMVEATEAVNHFYRVAGGRDRFDPGAVDTVSRLLQARTQGLTDRVRHAIATAASAPDKWARPEDPTQGKGPIEA